jgi:hypothetical protein
MKLNRQPNKARVAGRFNKQFADINALEARSTAEIVLALVGGKEPPEDAVEWLKKRVNELDELRMLEKEYEKAVDEL